MRIFSSAVRDASSVAPASGRGSFFGKFRRRARAVAIGIAIVLAMIGLGVGLRLADPWRWRGQKAPEESIHYHWAQANRASDNGDVTLARSHLEAIWRICPHNAQVHFLMARTCRRDNDPVGQEYLFLAESLGWPRHQIVLEQRLWQAESGDTWSVEESLLEELNRLPPEERIILEGLVKGYLHSARFADAADIATMWIKRFPGDWLAYLYRGRAYQGQGSWQEAVTDYQDTLKIRPDLTGARLWYAQTLLAFQDFQNALDNYQVYSKMVPEDWEALFAIAECQFSLGQPGAQATLENLLNKYPQHPGGLLLAARMDLAEDAPDRALVRLRKASALGPPDPEILQTLILALRKLNRQKEADQEEKEYGQILEKGKQLKELNEKIQLERADASLRYQAGMLSLELGQEKAAFDWFQSVFYIKPGHRPTHLALADYWAKHGQPERAAYHLRRAEGKRR
jgi:tetratricopeptide (TPR) repeat protein